MTKEQRAPIFTLDEAIMQCSEALQSKYTADESLSMLLQIIGEFYRGKSSYFFELDQETAFFYQKYDWLVEQNPQNRDFDKLALSALEHFSADRFSDVACQILYFETKSDPDSPITVLFQHYGVENMVLLPMIEKEETTGFVAVTNISLEDFDAQLLDCSVMFLQEALHKREMHIQLALLHNLDPLTGFRNRKQYEKMLAQFVEKPPRKLGVVTVQMAELEKYQEKFGQKYADVEIKKTSAVLGKFFDHPFYRVENCQFMCFVPHIEEATFRGIVDEISLQGRLSENVTFFVGSAWCCESYDLEQEILACSALEK